MSIEFLIGADPEVFVKTKAGEAVSAHGLIPGTKESPHPVKNGAVQVDGMALEFNIDPVPLFNSDNYHAFEAFNGNIVSVLEQLKEMTQKVNPELEFNISPVQDFDKDYLEAQPKEAKELGCNPDFNAYTMKQNPTPKGEEVSYRTSSGHLHFGWGADIPPDHPDHLEICCDFIKILDLTIGLYMTIIDDDPRRRVLYGRAGAFRPKTYGVEYRTPSSVWLKSEDRRRDILFLAKRAVTFHQAEMTPITFKSSFEEVERIINDGDYLSAYDLLLRVLNVQRNRSMNDAVKAEFLERCKKEGKVEEYDRRYPSTDKDVGKKSKNSVMNGFLQSQSTVGVTKN